jgi:hypothetical protein
MALTVAAVPTGIKAGVRISPRGVEITPTRALPLRDVTEKLNVCTLVAYLDGTRDIPYIFSQVFERVSNTA